MPPSNPLGARWRSKTLSPQRRTKTAPLRLGFADFGGSDGKGLGRAGAKAAQDL